MDGNRSDPAGLPVMRCSAPREEEEFGATVPENHPAAGSRGPAPWRASLDLTFRRIEPPGTGRAPNTAGRTVLARREHSGPIQVQRPFHPGDGACHVYLLHPPGGVARGDRIDVRVRVGPGASALLTTPAATKVYRSTERSVLTQRLEVCAGASLEWLPQETILYGGSRVSVRTEVRLDPAARFTSWEIVVLATACAWPADGDTLERARTLLCGERRCAATLIDGLLVVRMLADDAGVARGRLAGVWSGLRPLVSGLPACPPHIEVDPQTYEVRADGALLTCEPATVLPLAQRYFLF